MILGKRIKPPREEEVPVSVRARFTAMNEWVRSCRESVHFGSVPTAIQVIADGGLIFMELIDDLANELSKFNVPPPFVESKLDDSGLYFSQLFDRNFLRFSYNLVEMIISTGPTARCVLRPISGC